MDSPHDSRSEGTISSKKDLISAQKTEGSQKRKRGLDSSTADTSKSTHSKKAKKAEATSSDVHANGEDARLSTTPVDAGLRKRKKSTVSDASTAIPRGANDDSPENEKKVKSTKGKASRKRDSAIGTSDGANETDVALGHHALARNSEKARKKSKRDDHGEEEDGAKPKKDKFSGILSKFERSAKVKETAKGKADEVAQDSKTETAEPVVAHGLEPLPQPEPAPEKAERPTYSALPEWLMHPLRASAEEKSRFTDLGIDQSTLRILQSNGYHEAFAVQSAVLPLLLHGPVYHAGDLCISAATGSGKTLSYVLPMVKSLQQLPVPKLRGLIVVPTRELVKQARETCELIAAGSGLRIGSAIGNVPLRDEQQSLVRADSYFSPEAYDHQQRGDLEGEHWTNFNLQEYLSENPWQKDFLQDYVEKREANVDILICTPGRLVDHIRSTRGFTLRHLQWLVIDEADRLLNESFQEWVDVVMNSLDARKDPDTFGFTGNFLSSMGLPIRAPEPKKVVLSATMTRDISKLSSLRLADPKMVIIGSEDPALDSAAFDGRFTLPPTLKEYSISVGDGAEKPLYLLRLLLDYLKITVHGSPKRPSAAAPGSDDTSSDDTSSDESSSDDSSQRLTSEDSDYTSSDDESSEPTSSSASADSSDDSDSEEDEDEDVSKPGPARDTVLIFTKSSESASRLSRLLSILNPALGHRVGTIIKSNKSAASRKTLTAYRRGRVSVIVATDRASRGLDLRSLTHVVNYDVPSSITSYVHRVGRTARAGEKGTAWTLVAHREGRWFGMEVAKGADGKLTRSAKMEKVHVKLDGMDEAKARYGSALQALEEEVKSDVKTKE